MERISSLATKQFARTFIVVGVFILFAVDVWGQALPASGSYIKSTGSYVVPCGVTSINIYCYGGGGAGGGTNSGNKSGGGGGGGACTYTTVTGTANQTITFNVGAGGTGVSAANGAAGGETYVMMNAVKVSWAAGGGGGVCAASGAGGSGGATGSGTIKSGGKGGNGLVGTLSCNNNSGGGGGGAGTTNIGGAGGNGTTCNNAGGAGSGGATGGSNGASGISTGGNPGLPGLSALNIADNLFGGGGGGATSYSNGTNAGGAGDNGGFYITYSIVACCTTPSLFSVTGGGNGCVTTGVTVGLSGSQSGVYYQLYRGAAPVGAPVLGSGSAFNFANQTTAGTYTVQTTTSGGYCALSMTGNAVVTIDPISAGGSATASNTTICSGGNSTLTLSGYIGSIQWQSSPDNSTWTNIPGATLATYTTPALSATMYYCAIVTSGACPAASSSIATVTVLADPTISTQPTNPAAICLGGAGSIAGLTATGGIPSLTYQWQYFNGLTWGNVSNGTPTGAGYTNQTTAVLNISGITVAGAYQYKCIVSASGNGCTAATTNDVTVSYISGAAINTQPGNPASICIGGTALINGLVTTGATSYQWQYYNGATWNNVVNGTPSGSAYTNATGSALTISGISTAGTFLFQCIIGNGTCSVTSNAASLTVTPNTVSGSVNPGINICSGTNSTLLTLTGYTGTINRWEYSTNGGGVWSTIANTNTTYTATNIAVSTLFRAVVTSGACPTDNSSAATLTVVPEPSITIQPTPATQNVCQLGTAVALSITASNTTGYQWYSNGSNSNSGGTIIIGATGSTYTPPTATVGTTYYYCIVSNATCSRNSNVASVTINAPPTVSITSSSAYNTLCSAGANTSITLTATAGGVSYLWSTGATTPAISVSTAGTYTVTVTNAGCAAVSASSTVQSASINFSAITTASNITGFAGYDNDIVWLNAYPTQSVLFLNGFNGSWTGSIGGAWSPAVSTPTIKDLSCDGTDVTANPVLSIVTSDPNLYLGGEGFPFEGSHFVNFNSWVTAAGNEGYLTSPVFSTVGLTGVTVDFDFMQFANSSCGSSEYVRVQYCVNGGAWINVSTYRRDGITTSSSTQCPSWMNYAPTLPAGALNQGNVQIRFVFHSGTGCFCGLNLNIDNVRVTAVNTPGGYTYFSPYNWSAAGTAAGLFTINNPSSRSTFTNDLDNNSTTGNVTFTCAMTDANGCTYSASTDTIRVNPSQNGGAGTVTANPTYVCSGGSSVLTYVANGSVPATFQWQQSTSGSGSGFSDIPGANASTYTATNITQTTWYKIEVTDGRFISGICGSVLYSNVAVVTVPKTGTLSGPASVCSGYSATLTITGGTPGQGANSYQWYSSANAGGPWTDLGTTGSTTSFTTGSLTSATYFRVITTTSNPSCTLTSTAFLVSVNAGNIAATNNWNGSISTNWYEVRNWDCMVPVCGQDVLIASGKPRYPIIKIAEGSGAACRSITINSGASLTLGVAENLDVCGNWTNNGTFTPNSGSVTFTGTSAQAMNAPTTSFYRLIINNTGTGVTLGADMNVTNILTLIDGVVTTNASKMIVTSSAPAMVVNGGTNPGNYTNSWINGNLRRAFATNSGTYDFPVGCTSFAALARLTNMNITGITILDATFIAPLTQTTPLNNAICLDFGTSYYACFPEGYWHIEPTTPITGGNYTLKTYFNGFSSINSSYDNMFGLVKRASSSSSSMDWSTQIASPPDGAGFLNAASGVGRLYSDGYAERNTITQFSHFAIAYTNNEILPVTLLNFSGQCRDEKNVLKWSTASELNNDYFELQRSAEANTFQTIGIVDGAGNSNQVLNYSYEDMEPYMNSYYRLKQTDFDGSVSLSNIILLSRSGSIHGLSIYPNPFDQSFYVVLSSSSIGILAYRVTDVLGRTVLEGSFDIKEDSNTFLLDMSKISSGSYYLNVENKTVRLFKL